MQPFGGKTARFLSALASPFGRAAERSEAERALSATFGGSSLLRAKSRRKRRLRSVHPPAGGRQRGSQVWCEQKKKRLPHLGKPFDVG